MAFVAAGGLLAPAASRALVEAAILVPLAFYNAWITRSRMSYVLVAVSFVLLALATAFPLHVPAAPPPE